MCGIAGWLGTLSEGEKYGARMADALRHRGPDGQGIQSWREATLVHTRLSIIDLSPAGVLVPAAWCPPHGGDRGPPGRARHPSGAGAPMGDVLSYPTPASVCQPATAASPRVAGDSPRPLDLRDPSSWLNPCPGPDRRGEPYPAVWLRCQSQHSSPLPVAR